MAAGNVSAAFALKLSYVALITDASFCNSYAMTQTQINERPRCGVERLRLTLARAFHQLPPPAAA